MEVLEIWKQTRTAMTQEKLNRGLRTPVDQRSNSTSITTRTSPKTDLAERSVPKRLGEALSCELLLAIWSRQRLPMSSKRLSLKQKETDEGDRSDAEVLGGCHRTGCAVPDTARRHWLDRVL